MTVDPLLTAAPAQSTSSAQTPPPRSLSRVQLTLGLVLITLLPFGLVVLLYMTMPSFDDPLLQVQAHVGPRAWPADGDPEARVVPSLIVKNPTAEPWRNLNLSINHQFHYQHPDVLRAGEEIFIPLKFFHTKGNQYYPPESQPLKELTIYAQIPSGARAIVEIEGSQLSAPQR